MCENEDEWIAECTLQYEDYKEKQTDALFVILVSLMPSYVCVAIMVNFIAANEEIAR